VAVLRIVAGDEVVEVFAFKWILINAAALPLRADAPPVYVAAAPFFESEMFVGAQIVNPELRCPRFFGGGFAVEEEDVGLYPLRVENFDRMSIYQSSGCCCARLSCRITWMIECSACNSPPSSHCTVSTTAWRISPFLNASNPSCTRARNAGSRSQT
jgi:hypothetical protein